MGWKKGPLSSNPCHGQDCQPLDNHSIRHQLGLPSAPSSPALDGSRDGAPTASSLAASSACDCLLLNLICAKFWEFPWRYTLTLSILTLKQYLHVRQFVLLYFLKLCESLSHVGQPLKDSVFTEEECSCSAAVWSCVVHANIELTKSVLNSIQDFRITGFLCILLLTCSKVTLELFYNSLSALFLFLF